MFHLKEGQPEDGVSCLLTMSFFALLPVKASLMSETDHSREISESQSLRSRDKETMCSLYPTFSLHLVPLTVVFFIP